MLSGKQSAFALWSQIANGRPVPPLTYVLFETGTAHLANGPPAPSIRLVHNAHRFPNDAADQHRVCVAGE